MIKQAGIYSFYNLITQEIYVGSSKDLKRRIRNHLKGKSSNKNLQKAFLDYGYNNFVIKTWVLKDITQAIVEEQLWLNWLFNQNIKTYNISKSAIFSEGHGGCLIKHQECAEQSGGFKAIKRYAINLINNKIFIFNSSRQAEKITGVKSCNVTISCKTGKPENGKERWLFSDVSIDDLKAKFNSLTQKEIKGSKNYTFILYNTKNGSFSKEFKQTTQPKKEGINICSSGLGKSLRGANNQIINGYIVFITKINNIEVEDMVIEYRNRFNNMLTKTVQKNLEVLLNV